MNTSELSAKYKRNAIWEVIRFTLIELLVVIAVIAILASMLLPALGNARKRTKTLVCANNHKQIGTGVTFYIDDYNGHFPYTYTDNAGKPYRLLTYISRQLENDMDKPLDLIEINKCPADTDVWFDRTSYGASYYANVKKIILFNRPSETCLVADMESPETDANAFYMTANSPPRDYMLDAFTRHNGINVLFMDGHVSIWKLPVPAVSSDAFWSKPN